MTTNNTENAMDELQRLGQEFDAAGGMTQEDWDAAVAFWESHGPFRMGTLASLTEALSAHRIAARQAALEEAAKVAEGEGAQAMEWDDAADVANSIATAIRTLSTKEVEG